MHKQSLAVPLNGADPIDVTAYETETAGLVVHRTVPVSQTRAQVRTWVVAHAASGKILAPTLPNRRAAAYVADALGSLTDWSASEAELMAAAAEIPHFGATVRSATWNALSELADADYHAAQAAQ